MVDNAVRSPWPSRQERASERNSKREALLQAAVRSFNEKGFHATSLDEVAASMNVTKPTIYYYLGNKDEILFECVRRGLASIQEAAKSVENTNGTGLQRFRALMLSYARIMTEDFGMCVTRTADHELSDESRARFRALKRETDNTIRSVVEEGMADGSIASGDPKIVTFVATGALNWIARWYDPRGSMTAEDIAQSCVETLINGFRPHEFTGKDG